MVTRHRWTPEPQQEGRDERGQILLLVLALLILLGILVGALLGLATPSFAHAASVRNVNDTVAAADSGIEYGLQFLKDNPTKCTNALPPAPTINARTPLVSCSVLAPPSGTPKGINYLLLTSTAQISSGGSTMLSRAVVEVNARTGWPTIESRRTCRNGEC